MRLFYINYADLSVAYGATVCIVELARSLAKLGHEVTLIVPRFRKSGSRETGKLGKQTAEFLSSRVPKFPSFQVP